MNDYTKYADPFLGNGEIDLPNPTYPASSWHFIKGLSGNTSPAAALPFGKYSVLGYDGAYPTGNGINRMNCGGSVPKLYSEPRFIGLSHFQHSGTGAIGVYYNYALCSPFVGEFPDFAARKLISETARCGYYSAETELALAEATVSEYAALHRYSFRSDGGRIAVDFANNGLYDNSLREPASGKLYVLSNRELLCETTLSGVKLWFDVVCDGGSVSGLFYWDKLYGGDNLPRDLSLSEPEYTRFGGIFDVGRGCTLRVAVSAVSGEQARRLNAIETRGFDEVADAAEAKWRDALAKIEIDVGDSVGDVGRTDVERELTIFYSNLYHTLFKPCDLSGEGFLYDNPDGECVVDIATMWDIYKTQLPLLFTLYPDISRKFMSTLERFGEKYGYLPHCVLLSGNLGIETKQARMLAEYSIYDAYLRGIDADYKKLLELCGIDAARYTDYTDGGCRFASHTLDMSGAYAAMSALAGRLGKSGLRDEYSRLAELGANAFDSDGMMRADSDYYEGTRYNYSFRSTLYDYRLKKFGRERLEAEALRFFGFVEPDDFVSRFEGYNNETDMEAPIFLHELGLRDLMCDVIRSGLDSMFTVGRGGLPGNNDSGGLSSCYIWNAVGLFPISGQDRMVIVPPRFGRAVLHMPGGELNIVRQGSGRHTRAARFNGRVVADFELTAGELLGGGLLEVEMDE